MANFLQIQSEGVPKSSGIKPEPEYYMSEQQIINLLKHGSMDAFLDCLDFAPVGVIELVKKFAVSLPLDNYEKRQFSKVFIFDIKTNRFNLFNFVLRKFILSIKIKT